MAEFAFAFFRDASGRLRVTLLVDGRPVATKPAERVRDGAPPEERHRYNLVKALGLRRYGVHHLAPSLAEQLLSADAGDVVRARRIGDSLAPA